MKKNHKIHLIDLLALYNFVATHARCPDSQFDDFIENLTDRITKQDDPDGGFGPEIYSLYAAFGVGFVYGSAVEIDSKNEEVIKAIYKIRDEMKEIGLFPGLSMK